MYTRPATEEKFLKAYEAHADAIFRHCYFRVGCDRETALDLTQDTFLKTWDYLHSGKQVDHLKAFLYRVANNLLVDRSRKKREILLEEWESVADHPPVHVEEFDRHLEIERILNTLDTLSVKHKEVFVMRYVDGLEPREIAEVLGETPNTVSVRLNRATQHIKQILEPSYESI